MDREQLGKMKLEALRTLAAESGLDGAHRLGKAELLDHLAPATLAERAVDAVEHQVEGSVAEAVDRSEATQEKIAHVVAAVEEKIVHAVAAVEHKAHELVERVIHPHMQAAASHDHDAHAGAQTPTASAPVAAAAPVAEAAVATPPVSAARSNGSNGFGVPSATVHRQPQPQAPPVSEPIGMLDFEELPDGYGIDECEVLYKDPFWVFAYWEVTDNGLAAARAQLGQSADGAKLVLRLFTTVPRPEGVDRQLHDVELPGHRGRRYLQSPRPGAHLRVAVGLLSREGYFAPIAHSSLVRVPPAEPQPGPVEWMEVEPVKTRGRAREPIVIVRQGAERAERGVKEVHAPLTTETPSAGTSPTAARPGQPGWPFSGSSASSPSRGTR